MSCKVGGGEVSETRRVAGPCPVRWGGRGLGDQTCGGSVSCKVGG